MKWLLFISLSLVACNTAPSNFFKNEKPVAFFEGTWKVGDSPQLEIWEWSDKLSMLIGKVIQINNGDTLVFETLRIFKRDDLLIYEATVMDQNNGAAVEFKQVESPKNVFRFENHEHDFPNIIEYTKISEIKMRAIVGGKNGKNYESEYIKQ